jgi:hypothetical protein
LLISVGKTNIYGCGRYKYRLVAPSRAPIILAGVYASLYTDHALDLIEPDYIVKGSKLDELLRILSILGPDTGKAHHHIAFKDFPAPDYGHYHALDYITLRTSSGYRKGEYGA